MGEIPRHTSRQLSLGPAADPTPTTDELARRLAALTRKYADVERSSRAKSDMISALAHEFRTPLVAIIGYADLLEAELSPQLNEVQCVRLGRIRAVAWQLSDLVDEVLSLSRMEAGEPVPLQREQVGVGELVSEAVSVIAPSAEAKGLAVRTVLEEPTPELETDRDKVRRILLNLLGNAVKFTSAGEVCLEARRDGERELFEVSDTGQGIAAEHLDRIFERFWRVEAGAATASGTGLGLTIARELARLLGGDITVESEPGRGSTFTFWVPC